MQKIVFASLMLPRPSSETNALLLVESIRAFAGSLSQTPIWLFSPDDGQQSSSTLTDRLRALKVPRIPYPIDRNVRTFPFTEKVQAHAVAEARASGHTDLLAWIDANTVVLQDPQAFLLPEDRALGFRPVHHTLIGSRFEDPLDPFWTLIYQHCAVPRDRVFPMRTHVDNTRLRPYFNAGLLITRPETGLIRSWRDTFFQVYQAPAFQAFYQRDARYRIFMHQAVLSGIILATLTPTEMQELPPTYNYPLHLHEEDVTGHRPSGLEDLTTFRHEGFYEDPEWRTKMPAKAPLKQWIADRLI
jgi:hypothetical protein